MTLTMFSTAAEKPSVDLPTISVVQAAASEPVKRSRKSKALFGYAVAITTVLVVVLILGGVYYYRSVEILQDTIKTFHDSDKAGKTPVDRDFQIDEEKNSYVVHLNGEGIEPGTFVVMDYAKSMTGIYEPSSRRCYLIAGIRSGIADLKTFASKLEANFTQTGLNNPEERLNYQLADDYPVSDKSILPYHMKSTCAYLPIYWLEPATKDSSDEKRQKRATCVYRCYPYNRYYNICVLRYCVG